ncbi:uncharacterized protein LOC117642026 isoform X2 [Thrips palmi]|uniref:Uncharacterized protein LOC117642026 isoform X2 n=1 Tax=Thrips palmi TaxID=161013 RepID=A0A6P8Y7U4_THRPL|nr:uncharacterized protein LOC117642026 isoform X2 [Thrips palmi]
MNYMNVTWEPTRSRLLETLRQQIMSLEKKREHLQQEVRSIEKSLKTATQLDFNHNDNVNILTQCKVFGYFLTNCQSKEMGDGTKHYTAACEDKRHPFKITVVKNKDEVTAVTVGLSGTSPLNEIQIVLNNLTEDNCPYLVLSTIQQFIHLHNFRLRIFQEKLQGPPGEGCDFQVHRPDFTQEMGNRHYHITAMRGAIEIVWGLTWNKIDHHLAHEFIIRKMPSNISLKRCTDKLLDHAYSNRNARDLWEWWQDFCVNVAALNELN